MTVWRALSDTVMAADVGDMRLTVEAQARFTGEFRFVVLRRQYGQGSLFALVEMGTRPRLRDAMEAAEAVVSRLIV